MKKFNEFVSENDEAWYKKNDWVKHDDGKWRPNREIHMVRDKTSKIPEYKGRSDHDSGKAYAVLGSRRISGSDHEKLKKYHSSIAKEKGYTVHYHDE